MKKLLLMVLPGVLAISVSASMATERDRAEVAVGASNATKHYSCAEESKVRDLVLSIVNEYRAEINALTAQNTTESAFELFKPNHPIKGIGDIPVWVCNP